jgi:hypothetical protein
MFGFAVSNCWKVKVTSFGKVVSGAAMVLIRLKCSSTAGVRFERVTSRFAKSDASSTCIASAHFGFTGEPEGVYNEAYEHHT